MYYIYSIEHNLLDTPLYMGITDNPERRFKQHLTCNKRLIQWLDELRADYKKAPDYVTPLDLEPKQYIYAQTENKKLALMWEREHIEKYRPLLNEQYNEAGKAYHDYLQRYTAIFYLLSDAGVENADIVAGEII